MGRPASDAVVARIGGAGSIQDQAAVGIVDTDHAVGFAPLLAVQDRFECLHGRVGKGGGGAHRHIRGVEFFGIALECGVDIGTQPTKRDVSNQRQGDAEYEDTSLLTRVVQVSADEAVMHVAHCPG